METTLSEDQQVSAEKGAERMMETTCRKSSEDCRKKDVLNFVVEDVKDLESVTKNLKAAYDSVIVHQLDVIWISFSDCLKLTAKKLCPFVIDPFDGPVFDHLVQLNCRVIGPVCVLSCLRNNEPLPVRPYPVYSVAMRKITITCTNLSKTDREDVFRKTELMGGGCTRDLTKSVTHLVVGNVGSKKYRMAASLGLPIMTTSWIESLWEHDQYNPERHASEGIYKVHLCPVFKGLSICVSQLSSEERKAIKRLVEENGGNYSGALRSNDTTHLILLQPEGDKYNHAVNWKLHCVKADWVYDSISAGYCKDETLYRLENEESLPRVSTPRKSSSHKLNLDAEISKISSVSVSCLDETTRLNSIGQQGDNESVASVKSNKDSFMPLEAFDLALLAHSKRFLDGCKILVIGFSDSQSQLLSKMIAQAGGTELKKFNKSISHVIFEGGNGELIENIKSGSSRPHVVSCQWLTECFNAQKIIDETPYLYTGDTTIASINQNASLPAEEKENNFSGNVSQKTVLQNTEAMLNGVSSFMKECLDFDRDIGNNSVIPQQNNDSKVLAADHGQMASKDVDKTVVSVAEKPVSECFSDAPSEYCEEDEEEESLSLRGLKFVILGFGPMDTDILTDMIGSREGDIYDLNADCEVDIAVVPVFWEDEQPAKAKTVATNCWLQKCIEVEKLLPYNENPLFKPLCAEPCSQPLKKCVISISQYTGTERDCLRHIAEALGATYQEHFVRKATRKPEFKPSTHLIVSAPEGSKYEAAKKWNIPAVTKEWLIDAAKFGELPPPEMYLVEGVALRSQSSTSTIDCYHSMRNEDNQDKPLGEYGAESKVVFKTPNAKALCGNRVKELMQEDKALANKNPSVSTAFLNPDVPYHPDFSVGDMLDFLDSPCNPGNNGRSVRKQSIPIEEMFSHNLSLALEKFSGPITDSRCENLNSGSPKEQSPCNTGPLADVIVCVSNSKKLLPFKDELHRIVVSLGGECRWDCDFRCTHFVCQGPKNSFTREMRLARDEKKILVAPEWILACRDAWKHIDEALYPYSYKSNVPLSKLMSSKRSRSRRNKRASKGSDSQSEKSSSNEYQKEGEDLNVSRQLDQLIDAVKSVKTDQPCSRKISQMSESSPDCKKSVSNSKRCKKSKNPLKVSTADNDKAATVTSSREAPPRVVDTASSEPSQFVPITWDDPTRQHEIEVVCEHVAGGGDQGARSCSTCFPPKVGQNSNGLKKTLFRRNGAANNKRSSEPQTMVDHPVSTNNRQRSSVPPQPTAVKPDVFASNRQRTSEPPLPTLVIPNDYPSEPQEAVMVETLAMASNKKLQRKFMFSGFSESEKEQLSSVILKYGGEISADKSYDKTATHLIFGKPLKNEKLLSSVASGKWVLHKSYIEAVEKNKAFVNEEDYEWGNRSTKSFLEGVQNDSETTVKVAYCPRRWRMKISNENLSGAFCRWKVIIFSEMHKVSTYSKILRAGGASVVTVSSSPNLDGITHAFIESSCVSTMNIDIKHLMSLGIMCLKPEYLAYYLIEDPSPPEEDYLLLEAAEFLNSPTTASVMSKRCQNFSDKSAKRSRVW